MNGNPIGSFKRQDVELLLKDVSRDVEEKETGLREVLIQNGRHYSEDLPIEKIPSDEYMNIFHELFDENFKKVALYSAMITRIVLNKFENPVFVSLVRAGVPCGVLMRRYALKCMNRDIPHYGISIIRGKGFDNNALKHIIKENPNKEIVFVDGWTGKGMIKQQLEESCIKYNNEFGANINPHLAVLADPAYCTDLYATREDFINPSCCLNSTICGLISRSVLNDRLIGNNDYHGVKIYSEFAHVDLTNEFLDKITDEFDNITPEAEKRTDEVLNSKTVPTFIGMKTVKEIGEKFNISDINRIKPSIGETTRVLLRRVPDKILVKDMNSSSIKHIMFLANEKNVDIEVYKDMPYICCGLISNKKSAEI